MRSTSSNAHAGLRRGWLSPGSRAGSSNGVNQRLAYQHRVRPSPFITGQPAQSGTDAACAPKLATRARRGFDTSPRSMALIACAGPAPQVRDAVAVRRLQDVSGSLGTITARQPVTNAIDHGSRHNDDPAVVARRQRSSRRQCLVDRSLVVAELKSARVSSTAPASSNASVSPHIARNADWAARNACRPRAQDQQEGDHRQVRLLEAAPLAEIRYQHAVRAEGDDKAALPRREPPRTARSPALPGGGGASARLPTTRQDRYRENQLHQGHISLTLAASSNAILPGWPAALVEIGLERDVFE